MRPFDWVWIGIGCYVVLLTIMALWMKRDHRKREAANRTALAAKPDGGTNE